jgi:Tfp pilus assembly protein PilO
VTRGLSPRERLMVSFFITAAIAALFYLFIWNPQNTRHDELSNRLNAQRAEANRLQGLVDTMQARVTEFDALSGRIRLVEAKLPPERDIPRLIRQLQDVAAELKVKMTLLRPGPTQAGPATTSEPAQPQPAGTAQGTAQAAPAPPGRPGTPKALTPSKYQVFRIDLAFEGTYADLMAYLGRLEDFPRFIVLKQISITPGELPRLKVTLNAETFVLPRGAASQP